MDYQSYYDLLKDLSINENDYNKRIVILQKLFSMTITILYERGYVNAKGCYKDENVDLIDFFMFTQNGYAEIHTMFPIYLAYLFKRMVDRLNERDFTLNYCHFHTESAFWIDHVQDFMSIILSGMGLESMVIASDPTYRTRLRSCQSAHLHLFGMQMSPSTIHCNMLTYPQVSYHLGAYMPDNCPLTKGPKDIWHNRYSGFVHYNEPFNFIARSLNKPMIRSGQES